MSPYRSTTAPLILEPGADRPLRGFGLGHATTVATAAVRRAAYEIIGTKSGVVTVTVTSANRTESAQFTVGAETDK